MQQGSTNFAYLMNLLGVKVADLCEAVGADKTLVSRWRRGTRKLMAGHHWAAEIAAYFVQVDAAQKRPVLRDVLCAYYPGEDVETAPGRERLLTHWLTHAGQLEAAYQRRREGLFAALLQKVERLAVPDQKPAGEGAPPDVPVPSLDNTVVYGIEGVQGSALQFLEMIAQQPEPLEMLFVCPEGLDMLTRDKRFIPQFFDALMNMFAAGHRMSVVVRTDYKITDISAFSGPWLVAHLLGYIQSYYYDDFVNTSRDKMLAVVPGMMAGRASENEEGKLYTAIRFDENTVKKTHAEIKQYQAKSKQRFHYHLFEQPDGFLRGVAPLPERMHYQFARLPHFGLVDAETARQGFGIGREEAERLRQEFGLLALPVEFYDAQTPVRHLYCEEDIEAALLKSRHACPALTAICGRRVVMTTQTLVDRLARMKQLLETRRNFEVCFLADEQFRKIRMQIAAWGDVAAIGWIAGGKSTACRDYTNVNALAGFCEGVWGQIPGVMKNRRTAIRKLNTWLKKAEKYGYSIPLY